MLKKSIVTLGFIALSIPRSFAEGEIGSTPNQLQDTQKAYEYFDAELSYKSNPYFVSRAIKEKLPNVNIVDVRSAKAYNNGHIPGAVNVSDDLYGSFEGSETVFPGLRKDAINYVYCYTETCNLGQKAAKKFTSLGYPVKEIVGGFETWVKQGYPVETSTAKS